MIRLGVLALSLALGACVAAHADDDRVAQGKAAFATVHAVFLHPRCMNCHPAGDAPLQHDDSRPHAQNITRRSARNGLTCATCHRSKNGTRPNTPPGAPSWHLPPPETPMIFEGRTPAQLCAQLKDPAQTGGRDLAATIRHVADDALVGWGWDPGPGRTPVPIPRATLVAALERWVAAGAPCPD
ncbi:MAG: hypothetical protein H0T89_14145 [Deltaproteobacteria bacterium]|nr:hypothetical protein [Deltaproteobacteria bacterium]MDQ3300129.1 hypothetical protein [Myxococcota bacterium]